MNGPTFDRRTASLSLLALFGLGIALLPSASPGTPADPGGLARSEESTEDRTATPAARRRHSLADHSRDGLYHAPVGTRLSYGSRVDLDFRAEVGTQTNARTERCTARLFVDIVERGEDRILIAVTRRNVRLDTTPSALPDTLGRRAALDATFLVELGADGRVTGYRFPPQLSPRQRSYLRTLTGTHTFAVPSVRRAAWERAEGDGTGRYRAGYRLVSDHGGRVVIERRKLRYERIACVGTLPELRLGGASRATLDREVGWLRSAQVDETTAARVANGDRRAVTRLRATLSLLETGETPPGLDLIAMLSWQRRAAGGQDEDLTPSREERRAELRCQLADKSFDGVLDDLVALAAQEGAGRDLRTAWSDLAALLELDAALAARVHDLLRAGRLGETVDGLLLTALGAAGTDAAQIVLLDVHGDARFGVHARARAALAMSQLATPTRTLVAEVGRRLEGATAFGEVEGSSLLAFGVLASRLEAALDGSRRAFDVLVDLQPHVNAHGATEIWLLAMGNTDSERALPHVAAYLDRADDRHRAAAVRALQGLSDPEVVPLLSARARDDHSPWVRAEAVRSLSRQATSKARAAVRERALRDPSELVRLTAIRALGPDSRTTLERIAREDRSQRVRKAARRKLDRAG